MKNRLLTLFILLFSSSMIFSQTIPNSPEGTSEGIWFVIQNKTSIETDHDVPAMNMALKANHSGTVEIGKIPIDNSINYDEFLWRTVHLPGGKFKLINKKEGESKALSASSGAMTIASIANVSDQEWILENSDLVKHGTNSYTLSTTSITSANAFMYDNSLISVTNKDANQLSQCWVLQPMALVDGFALPTATTADHYRTLDAPFGFKMFATPTTSDWALLNAYFIYKNMFNALLPNNKSAMSADTRTKSLLIISKDDPNVVDPTTPYLYGNFISSQLAELRGGVIFHPGTIFVLISEEMMNKVGVYTRGPSDKTYREFDQVVHEMAHAIDNICGLNTSANPLSGVNGPEWFPFVTQAWFNSDYATLPGKKRYNLNTGDNNYLITVYNQDNIWFPPRNFRGADPYALPACTTSPIAYVDGAKSTSGDGSSWSAAFRTLEEALSEAHTCNINEIRVASGTYMPSNTQGSTDPRDATFAIMRSRIKILGSYNPITGVRDIANPSILSGDIGNPNDESDNSYHVLVMGDEMVSTKDSTILDGFIITKGNANGSTNLTINNTTFFGNNGGGIHIQSVISNIVIQNCFIVENKASDGGGLSIHFSSPHIINSVLSGNIAGSGGGALLYNSTPTFINCTITKNEGNSGGLNNYSSDKTPKVINTIVWGNKDGNNNPSNLNNNPFNASYSIIEGSSLYPGTGNSNSNPKFVGAVSPKGADNIWGTSDDGLKVNINSPAIDAGDNTSIGGLEFDITGSARIQNTTVDIGAYEGGVACSNPRIYVDAYVIASGNGYSWSTAFKTLEEALAKANTCNLVKEISVASGTYYPTNKYGSGDSRDATFAITRSNLKINGGYNAATGVRNTATNPTILSGDLGNLNDDADNSYHVVVMGGIPVSTTDSTILDGFIITKGNAYGSNNLNINGTPFYRNNGGGIHINNVYDNSVIRNCFIVDNTGESGGGMSIHFSSPTLINSVLTGNIAGSGGGAFIYNSAATFINCTVSENQGIGGGLYVYLSQNSTLLNTIVWGNKYQGNTTPSNLIGDALNVSYSIIEGVSVYSGTGNSNSNPLFTDASNAKGNDNIWGTADDGLMLLPASPAIDAGSNSASLGTSVDISGKTRIQNNILDMGAYEYQALAIIPNEPVVDNQIFCGPATIADLEVSGENIQWYALATGGTALSTSTSLSTGTYYVTQTVNGYESTRKVVTAMINQVPNAPTASAQELCINSTVADLMAAGSDIQWFSTLTGGASIAPETALATGTYYASQTVNTCESERTLVDVIIHTTPFPTASPNQILVPGSTVADLVASGTDLKWYDALSGGTALVSTTAIADGNYYVSQTLNNCESERLAVEVSIQTPPKITIRYVKESATGAGDGSSWENASSDLQAMIDIADVEEVWVAGGTYKPTEILPLSNLPNNLPTDRDKGFLLKKDVKIYGGFVGNETSLSQRDLSLTVNTSTLSGDFNDDDVVTGYKNTLTFTGNTENAYHVVIGLGDLGTAVLDGLTIKGGAASVALTSSIEIGSTIYPVIRNTGGGLYLQDVASPGLNIKNVIITNNIADGLNCRAGGMAVINSFITMEKVTLTGNKSPVGGAIYNYGGNISGNYIKIYNNLSTTHSGGIINFPNSTSKLTLINSAIYDNYASTHSAINGGILTLINTTIGNNFGQNGSSRVVITDQPATIQNSVIYGNAHAVQIPIISVVQNSLVQGFTTTTDNNNFIWNTTDPLFVDPEFGNFRLQDCSSLINAGDNAYLPSGITKDLDGNDRIFRGTVDIGVYESSFDGTQQDPFGGDYVVRTYQNAKTTVNYTNECGSLVATVTNNKNLTMGFVNARVKLLETTPAGYVRRLYQITPEQNPTTADATVTLYYNQEDFDLYNLNPVNKKKLPQDPTDEAGKLNLLLEKRSGTSADGSGTPESFSGDITNITPDITWNVSEQRWEVTFSVVGFSGFFVKTRIYVLPMTLLEFNGKLQNKNAVLNWKTENEQNSARFEIERSADGKSYTAIGQVKSANIPGSHTYGFTDNTISTLGASVVYYRLKQIDLDGNFSYSKIVALTPENKTIISLYPNPATEKANLALTVQKAAKVQLRVMDNTGRVVSQEMHRLSSGTNTLSIDIRNLSSGMYYIELKGETILERKSFVKL